ncbi:MAG: DUF1549 domain-containing protein [Saprospiraceae bacterium]|nr:DUF1549 domain-containing protein [Saprospiraceae bacterium]
MSSKYTVLLLLLNIILIGFLAVNHRAPDLKEDPELMELLQKINRSGKEVNQALLSALNIKIRAIWTHKCFQCHSSEKRKGELALDHYEGVLAGGEDGEILVKGQSAKSDIIRRLKLPRGDKDAMPPKGTALSPLQINAIATWIDHGAYWVDSTIKLFYEAPLRLIKPELPASKTASDHDIDRFIHPYFKQQRIKWPKPLSDHQFIRKVYLDITGLLPVPSAVDQFIQDTKPNKRNELIQQLLNDDENYALHWMSFWNDLLRNDYSGTGFITGGRKQISNWLYNSLKKDSSYIEIVRSLINPHPGSAGFIQGIQWRGEVNSSQSPEMQAAQNVSQALLGMNLKCASCHNSFVNNFSLEQSYGFASVFARQPLEMHRCDVAMGIRAQPSFIYPQLGAITADSLNDRLAELSDLLVKPSNGRLYRTFVNRVWAQLMGRGIIGKVDEMDQKPWSQDLLDFLAAEFRDNQGNIKDFIQYILTSRIYQSQPVDYGTYDEMCNPGFVFKGPAIRRLHAEQMLDALSATIQPMYPGVSFDPAGYTIPAYWIWYPDKDFDRITLPKPDTVFLRRIINLPSIQKAELRLTADDEFQCYLNEQLLAEGSDYRHIQILDLSQQLKKGKNIFAIQAVNKGKLPNPSGVLFHLRAIGVNGDTVNVYSDTTWVSSKVNDLDHWKKLKFADTAWSMVHRYGSYSNSNWGKLRRFNFDTASFSSFSRASLLAADPLLKALGRPTRENITSRRSEEPGLLQCIALTNDPLLHRRIQEGSLRWLEKYRNQPDVFIDQLFLQLMVRPASKTEKNKMMKYFENNPTADSVADMIWAIIVSPEFQFI